MLDVFPLFFSFVFNLLFPFVLFFFSFNIRFCQLGYISCGALHFAKLDSTRFAGRLGNKWFDLFYLCGSVWA